MVPPGVRGPDRRPGADDEMVLSRLPQDAQHWREGRSECKRGAEVGRSTHMSTSPGRYCAWRLPDPELERLAQGVLLHLDSGILWGVTGGDIILCAFTRTTARLGQLAVDLCTTMKSVRISEAIIRAPVLECSGGSSRVDLEIGSRGNGWGGSLQLGSLVSPRHLFLHS